MDKEGGKGREEQEQEQEQAQEEKKGREISSMFETIRHHSRIMNMMPVTKLRYIIHFVDWTVVGV